MTKGTTDECVAHAHLAIMALIAGREENEKVPQVLSSLDYMIALMLYLAAGQDHDNAVKLFEKGLIPHVTRLLKELGGDTKPLC